MKIWKQVAIHLLLWLGYVLLYATLWRGEGMTFTESIWREIALLPVKAILVYVTIYYLVPHHLQRKRYITFALLLIVVLAGGGLLHNFYLHQILSLRISRLPSTEAFFDWERITKRMTYLNSPLLFSLTIVALRNWYEQKERNAKIVEENLSVRLQLLTNQMQPHFFFNTLNNLYSLALQKSDQTPVAILKLANLMRYLTEKHEYNWVSVRDEVEFIKNYTELEQMRYQDKVTILWNISVDAALDAYIPPLILSTFIENAFTHGVSAHTQAAKIKLELKTNDGALFYSVENTKTFSNDTPSAATTTSTGLTNLKSRLEILYNNNFDLSITNNRSSFSASFRIPLLYEKV